MSSDLHSLINGIRRTSRIRRNDDWKAVLERLDSHPHERVTVDRRGRTLLHAACAKQPPLEVVDRLLEFVNVVDRHGRTPLAIAVCSDQTSLEVQVRVLTREACARPDALGVLPLHLACDGTRPKLVRELLRVYPEAAKMACHRGRTPLHVAVEASAPLVVIEALVQAAPEAVLMDQCGVNPLFSAIGRKANVEVVRCLVEACPGVVHSKDRRGAFPLRLAIENQAPLGVLKLLCVDESVVVHRLASQTALHHVISRRHDISVEAVQLLVERVPLIGLVEAIGGFCCLETACLVWERAKYEESWRRLMLLMRGSFYGSIASDQPALHAVVGMSAPIAVVRRALLEYRDDWERLNDQGFMPIHAAIVGPPVCIPSVEFIEETRDVQVNRRLMTASYKHAMYRFLCNREAVIMEIIILSRDLGVTDARGRSPMLLAASASLLPVSVLEKLWTAVPNALEDIDPETSLYPFQVAALPRNYAKGIQPITATLMWQLTDGERLQVTSIFELLRQRPDLVHR